MRESLTLDGIAEEVRGCLRCRLAQTRTVAVPGHGDPRAPLVLVGEAPGRTEDETGLPFQGMSGRFLDRSLAELGVHREQLFVTSVNKCRPPGNRTPRRDEREACLPYLHAQLQVLRPKVVLAMGGHAAGALHPAAGPGVGLEPLRQAPVPLHLDGLEAELRVTCHPAAAMRFPAQRERFKADLAAACRAAAPWATI